MTLAELQAQAPAEAEAAQAEATYNASDRGGAGEPRAALPQSQLRPDEAPSPLRFSTPLPVRRGRSPGPRLSGSRSPLTLTMTGSDEEEMGSKLRWPVVSPTVTFKSRSHTSDSSPMGFDGASPIPLGLDVEVATRLPPPLKALQENETIDPEELQAYRADYQAFRRGYALGARGEIERVCLLDNDTDDPTGSQTTTDKLPNGVVDSSSGDSRGENAYYSEPERETSIPSPSPWRTFPHSAADLTGLAALPCSGNRGNTAAAAAAAATAAATSIASALSANGAGPMEDCQQQFANCPATETLERVPSKRPSSREMSVRRSWSFFAWLSDEVQSRPDERQLTSISKSHLVEVVKVPWRLEKLLGFGMLLCLDILLHELSFTALQVVRALPRLLTFRSLTVTETCDVVRLALLSLNVCLVHLIFDVSKVYHYIRGESFLKLYVIFNMLEMFERWIRSLGVDLFDHVASSVRKPWKTLLPKLVFTLMYCFVHSFMHCVRILLLNVAINTSSNQVFLIMVTNNFGEIKSTVFKKYDEKSLFPIVTSDITERFYLILDIIFVLLRLSISPRRGMHGLLDIAWWLCALVFIEVGTDWIKFCLIMKFSNLNAAVLENYKVAMIADILLCRSCHLSGTLADAGTDAGGSSAGTAGSAGSLARAARLQQFRGIHSFSHVPARRIGFSGVPMSTLVVLHFVMLLWSPCTLALATPRSMAALFVAVAFMLAFLAKVLLGAVLLGYAATRRELIAKWLENDGQELFKKLKSL